MVFFVYLSYLYKNSNVIKMVIKSHRLSVRVHHDTEIYCLVAHDLANLKNDYFTFFVLVCNYI